MAVIAAPQKYANQYETGIQAPDTSQNKLPSGYKLGRIQQFTPEQMKVLEQFQGYLGPESFLGKLAGGDEKQFQQMEAPALKQFNELIGGIGSRFSGMGMGARKSSGFQQATTSAASNFAEQLQSNRMNLQKQALEDIMNYSNIFLSQKPFEQQLIEKQQQTGGWGSAAKGAASGAGMGAAFGPWGALAGGVIGGAAGYFS